jgi:hypothetical protein
LTSFKNFKNQGVTRVERRCDFFIQPGNSL